MFNKSELSLDAQQRYLIDSQARTGLEWTFVLSKPVLTWETVRVSYLELIYSTSENCGYTFMANIFKLLVVL